MEKMTWNEAVRYMKAYNREHKIDDECVMRRQEKPKCEIVAVISEDSFNEKLSLEERSYAFSNYNSYFMPRTGYSIRVTNEYMTNCSVVADSLDGSDLGVRLDYYLKEFGNKVGWTVEYCYIKSD